MIIHPALPVLIVDDSALARQSLKAIVEGDPGFYALTAGDPYEAVERMRKTVPAVILLDVNMPRMDGITFLRKLMLQHPLPVLLCTDEPRKALAGLELGAIEVIPKPRWDNPDELLDWGERLRESLRLAVAATSAAGPAQVAAPEMTRQDHEHRRNIDAVIPPLSPRHLPPERDRIIAIGASTGGVQALARLLADFPANSPGIVVVQHMQGGGHTEAFADRLDRDPKISVKVKVGEHRDPIRAGAALIAPDGVHSTVRRVGNSYRLELVEGPPVSRFRPSVDVLYRSAAQAAGDRAVGVILTGMLDDGARCLVEMRDAGAFTIAQDKATSIVFGMNAEAVRRGGACQVLPLDKIALAAVSGGR